MEEQTCHLSHHPTLCPSTHPSASPSLPLLRTTSVTANSRAGFHPEMTILAAGSRLGDKGTAHLRAFTPTSPPHQKAELLRHSCYGCLHPKSSLILQADRYSKEEGDSKCYSVGPSREQSRSLMGSKWSSIRDSEPTAPWHSLQQGSTIRSRRS